MCGASVPYGLGEALLEPGGPLALAGVLVWVGLGVCLVQLLEVVGLLGGGLLPGLPQQSLQGLHLLPEVTVGLLQGPHLQREGPHLLLLLKEGLLHRRAEQLPRGKSHD